MYIYISSCFIRTCIYIPPFSRERKQKKNIPKQNEKRMLLLYDDDGTCVLCSVIWAQCHTLLSIYIYMYIYMYYYLWIIIMNTCRQLKYSFQKNAAIVKILSCFTYKSQNKPSHRTFLVVYILDKYINEIFPLAFGFSAMLRMFIICL